MLLVKDLRSFYGQIEALHGVNIKIEDSEICCIIGSNGAGKTTLLRTLSGIINKTGSIEFDGIDISSYSAKKIASLGIGHVLENRHVFPKLTVEENLIVGTISWHGMFGKKPYSDEMDMVYKIFPRLEERKKQLSWTLSGGEQQMLAIGRALMAKPKLLMLDEPSMGLAPVIVQEMFKSILRIQKETNISILLVEQNANLALSVSNYSYVLERGNVVIEGASEIVKNDERVISAYMGAK
jgi:branched-chain amino acid transport system ATP-binding protein